MILIVIGSGARESITITITITIKRGEERDMPKLDFKKQYKDLYTASARKAAVVRHPIRRKAKT